MKSLIEESSSIAKAIEKGWERAGKPQSFSIKIFELPERNFLGMTTKYAKVGIFFSEEKNIPGHQPKKDNVPSVAKQRRSDNAGDIKKNRADGLTEASDQQHKNQAIKQQGQKEARVVREKKNQLIAQAHGQEIQSKALNTWSEEMVASVTQWLTLNPLIVAKNVTHTTMINDNQLVLTFSGPLAQETDKQITIFRSFSYLIMASLRTKFKKDVKGLRVMLRCEEQ